jgi:hypothetical protein
MMEGTQYTITTYLADPATKRMNYIETVVFQVTPEFKVVKRSFSLPCGDSVDEPIGAFSLSAWSDGIRNLLFGRSASPFLVSRKDEDDGSAVLQMAQRAMIRHADNNSMRDDGVRVGVEYPAPWSMSPERLEEDDKAALRFQYMMEEL